MENQRLQRQMRLFWDRRRREAMQADSNALKNHQLPLARIKKIMKADVNVHMVAADTPVLFSRACELFILELTLRSWLQTEENRRRMLQCGDIVMAVHQAEHFDFLLDILPVEGGGGREVVPY